MIINLIQDIPTPHNNLIIKSLYNKKFRLKLWYSKKYDKNFYGWKTNLADQHIKSSIYGTNLNILFILKCLFSFNEKFIFVGWQNINTKILHLLFFIFRKKYNHWTDLPNFKFSTKYKNFLRQITNFLLKYSNCKIICVGKVTKDYFLSKKFNENRLYNLPILFEKKNFNLLKKKYLKLNSFKYYIKDKDFIISSGSRFVYEKGFDLAINAISKLINQYKHKNIKYLICGQGPENQKLKKMIISRSLRNNVFLINWLSYEEFIDLICSSNLFLHPARFDAYGPVVISNSLGIPTIASKYSGSAKDIIINNINGIVYDPKNSSQLSNIILKVYRSKQIRQKLSQFSKIYLKNKENSALINNMIINLI